MANTQDKTPRPYNYFLTIHQSAKCYDQAIEIARSAKTKCWAGIYHDQDMEVADDGSLKPAPTHIHIAIEFKDGKAPTAVAKMFPGAHVDVSQDIKGSYRYLIHNTEKSREKYQYPAEKIITDFPSKVKAILEEPAKKEAFEFFDETQWMKYIIQGVTNPWIFVKRFGLVAWKQYGRPFMDVVSFAKTDTRANSELMEYANKIAQEDQDYPWKEEDDE